MTGCNCATTVATTAFTLKLTKRTPRTALYGGICPKCRGGRFAGSIVRLRLAFQVQYHSDGRNFDSRVNEMNKLYLEIMIETR